MVFVDHRRPEMNKKLITLKMQIIKTFRTQSDFAMKVNAHESKVSQVIQGRRKISPIEAKRWAETLGCSLSLLSSVTKPY
jgi:plasmid maintenance system antidote protein VapI